MLNASDDEENPVEVKRIFVGIVLFFIGLSLLMVVLYGGWNPGIFIFSQFFMILGIIIMVTKKIREQKKHSYSEPQWVEQIRP